MEDEPTLPTLPDLPPSLSTQRRKRSRVPDYSSTSSDPAFFSSDDDPALDNYQTCARRKKRYVGAWFDQQPASSDSALGDDNPVSYPPPRRNRGGPNDQARKREFKRQLDSGVWMDTDGVMTDTDDALVLDEMNPPIPRLNLPRRPSSVRPPTVRPPFQFREYDAQEIIRECVENGEESVDLT